MNLLCNLLQGLPLCSELTCGHSMSLQNYIHRKCGLGRILNLRTT